MRQRDLSLAREEARSAGGGPESGAEESGIGGSELRRQLGQFHKGRARACARVRPAQERCEARLHALQNMAFLRWLMVLQTEQEVAGAGLGDLGAAVEVEAGRGLLKTREFGAWVEERAEEESRPALGRPCWIRKEGGLLFLLGLATGEVGEQLAMRLCKKLRTTA